MNSSETVFLHNALGHQNGVLEVVAVPGHERDAHVLAQGQLTHVDGRTVSQDVLARNHVTFFHQRTLVDAGVLVGTGILDQGVDIDTRFARFHFVVVDTNNDTTGVDGVDHAATASSHTHTGVARYVALHAGAHQRLLGA